jgi:hypothetical protein
MMRKLIQKAEIRFLLLSMLLLSILENILTMFTLTFVCVNLGAYSCLEAAMDLVAAYENEHDCIYSPYMTI